MRDPALLLGIDTCGPSGSVALGRLAGQHVEILGQAELAGRTYSSTLIAAAGELLARYDASVKTLDAIVVVHGPGSFTGVRVGLSATKGLAEAAGIPVVAISRLAVLAGKAGAQAASLDAHRHEIFLRMSGAGADTQERLTGVEELAAIPVPITPVAVCDEDSALLMASAWPGVTFLHVPPPTAADALMLAAPRIAEGAFANLALLDGHYLRRSDAEIFGAAVSGGAQGA